MLRGFVLLIAGLASAQADSVVSSPDGVPECERKALAARRAIEHGRLHIRLEHWNLIGGRKKTGEDEIQITFDRDKIRFERPSVYVPRGGKRPTRPSKRTIVVTPEEFMFYDDWIDENGVGLMVEVGRRAEIRELETAWFDPRTIGFVARPADLLSGATLDRFVTYQPRRECSVRREVLDGVDVFRVHYRRDTGMEVRLWFAPEQGYGLVRAELEGPYGRHAMVDAIGCKLKRYDGNVWFPERVWSRRSLDGERRGEDLITILDADFQKPVDPALFTLSSFGIPIGRRVYDRSRSRTSGG
jgi:hypothetical protein